jgi:hypothetical protein
MRLSRQILLCTVFALATMLAAGSTNGATTYDLASFPFTFSWATDVHATLETSAYGTYTTEEEIEAFFNQATYSATMKDGTTTIFEMDNSNATWDLMFGGVAGGVSAILTCTPTELTLDFSTPNEITGADLLLRGYFEQPNGHVAWASWQYTQENNITDFNFAHADYDAVNQAGCSVACDAPFIFPAIVLEPAERVEQLIVQVTQSELQANRTHPLLASLEAALASFERESLRSGVNQLRAFQNKVRAQVAPKEAVLAATWIESAQEIIDAVQAMGGMSLR